MRNQETFGIHNEMLHYETPRRRNKEKLIYNKNLEFEVSKGLHLNYNHICGVHVGMLHRGNYGLVATYVSPAGSLYGVSTPIWIMAWTRILGSAGLKASFVLAKYPPHQAIMPQFCAPFFLCVFWSPLLPRPQHQNQMFILYCLFSPPTLNRYNDISIGLLASLHLGSIILFICLIGISQCAYEKDHWQALSHLS